MMKKIAETPLADPVFIAEPARLPFHEDNDIIGNLGNTTGYLYV